MTRPLAQIAAAYDQHMTRASIPLRALAAMLVALFALDNVLLLGLLGQSPSIVAALGLLAPAVLAFLTWKAIGGAHRVSVPTIALCLAVAAILLVLGGEGRLFYATADWQIRDAVLADMGKHRWPFDYWLDGKSQLLRAPVGMYLVPALLGGASQIGRDWALLAHNALVLGLLLAIGSALFEGRRTRWIALIVFVAFSGLDIIGNLINQSATHAANWEHIERWAGGYQYSSHITQIFWVPQHGFAGWTAALTYMLWRKGIAPIGLFAASLPLVALWSPFALFGALPFAIYAGVSVLLSGAWSWRDVLICGIAALLAVPALLYLSADAASVGGGLHPPVAITYVLLLALEVIPFLLPLLRDKAADRPTVLIAGTCLFLMPLWVIGMNNDFEMRASIVPLALLAVAFAEWGSRQQSGGQKAWFILLVALGSVTGFVEMARSFRLAPSPAPRCSLAGAWHRQTGMVVPHASYFAARSAFPVKIDPAERVSSTQPARCWDQPWHRLRHGQERP
ncbi:hypothetical protein [Sphingobium bisphenolivorans]|uniref:hypothetical protein n=1 Tax=Sphingobium bisphenolivorans TaxID=1335760 RepID=UPI001269F398|nr:hypothetical protein [Sphingobium bisphenolivorans]